MNNAPDVGPGSSVSLSPAIPAVHQDTIDTPDIATPPGTYERWTRLPKPRGRQPRDPHTQAVRFHCRDADEMEFTLRDYLFAPTVPAEHASLEFIFPVAAAFMVYAADFKNHQSLGDGRDKQPPLYGKLDRTAISVIDALAVTENPKDQMRRQKAIAKVCVEAIEKADGFRYSFHNNWLSREDEACRFSYFCNDSTLNKGRAANEGAGMAGKKMRKPVYDCQGLVAVKFSFTKQSLEVHYKHVPLHKTYAERAPPPRRDSKRRKMMEVLDPDSLPSDKRRRKSASVENLAAQVSISQEGTEFVSTAVRTHSVGGNREGNLQPLPEVIAATDDLDLHGAQPSESNSISQQSTRSEPTRLASSALNTTTPMLQGAGRTRYKRPAIPGTMAGSVQNGHLNWSAASSSQTKTPSGSAKNTPSTTRTVLFGITEAASAAPAQSPDPSSIALSELETLKRKLEEAEERIRKLESEKVSHVPPPPPQPPQHVLWPPPPGYPPTASYPYHHHQPSPYPPLPAPQHQIRFQPPLQRPFPPMPYDQLNNVDSNKTPTPIPEPSSHSIPSMPGRGPVPESAQLSTPQRSNPQRLIVGTKFKFYTPVSKTKQTPERMDNTASTQVVNLPIETETTNDNIVDMSAMPGQTLQHPA